MMNELKECTFSPHINKKIVFTGKSAEKSDSPDNNEDPYTRLYEKHKE